MPTPLPPLIVFWVRAVSRAPALAGLYALLHSAITFMIESAGLGQSGFYKVAISPTAALPTYAAIDDLLTRVGGWDLCPVEPKHSLFLFAKDEDSEGARPVLERWAVEELDLEISITDHPGVEGMVRADVIGTLSEETFHHFDRDFFVWALDPEPLRAQRAQSEPAMCATCDGCGCTECGQTGIVPCPIGGYDGKAGGP